MMTTKSINMQDIQYVKAPFAPYDDCSSQSQGEAREISWVELQAVTAEDVFLPDHVELSLVFYEETSQDD